MLRREAEHYIFSESSLSLDQIFPDFLLLLFGIGGLNLPVLEEKKIGRTEKRWHHPRTNSTLGIYVYFLLLTNTSPKIFAFSRDAIGIANLRSKKCLIDGTPQLRNLLCCTTLQYFFGCIYTLQYIDNIFRSTQTGLRVDLLFLCRTKSFFPGQRYTTDFFQ